MADSMYFKDWLDKANNDLLAAEAILAYYEDRQRTRLVTIAIKLLKNALKRL